MKKITEASVLLNISKQALYKKVKINPYKKHTKKIQGALHISDEGIALIREETIQPNSTDFKPNSQLVENLYNQVKSKDSEVEFLRNQVNKLTRTLETVEKTNSEQVNQVYKLLEQQQILTLNYQNKIKALEEPKIKEATDNIQSNSRKLTWLERITGIVG